MMFLTFTKFLFIINIARAVELDENSIDPKSQIGKCQCTFAAKSNEYPTNSKFNQNKNGDLYFEREIGEGPFSEYLGRYSLTVKVQSRFLCRYYCRDQAGSLVMLEEILTLSVAFQDKDKTGSLECPNMSGGVRKGGVRQFSGTFATFDPTKSHYAFFHDWAQENGCLSKTIDHSEKSNIKPVSNEHQDQDKGKTSER